MIDYAIYYRRAIDVARIKHEIQKFDIFISAFNSSERVGKVFHEIKASTKIWLIHPEYCYLPIEEPAEHTIVRPNSHDEVIQVDALLREIGDCSTKEICIDTTGFMRHVLIFLIAKLAYLGAKNVTTLYSEPASYAKREDTAFSTTTSGRVRTVRGMSSANNSRAKDHLVIAVGYDHKLISEVSNTKDDSIIYPLFAFPSLSADMYQQSAIRAAQSGDIALRDEWVTNRRFAPANDPFATAAVVSDLVREIDRAGEPANIYLAPLSTKVQALGFSLYWQLEGRHRNGGVSILLPECVQYSRETSVGLKRLWLYTLEFS